MTIKEDMIINIKKALKDLKENRAHPLPCYCFRCIYSKYKEKPRNKSGKPFGMLTFLAFWLVYEVKKAYLIEEGKAEEININGRILLKGDMKDYERAPYIKKTKEILEKLYKEEENNSILDLAPLLDYLIHYRWRTKKPNFLKLIKELDDEIWWDWLKTQPPLKKKWDRNLKDLKFAQRVADFMYLQPKKEVSRYVLLKHFSNKRKDDIVRIHNILELNYGIQFKDKQGYRAKSTIYYSFMRSSRGRYWRVGI